MIYISSGALQKEIITLLEESNTEIVYRYVEKRGIILSFSVNTDDLDKAISLASKIIKNSSIGKMLYFQITK